MADVAKKTKIFWSVQEKSMLCAEATRRLYSLEASSKLIALNQAQTHLLPESRRRKLLALTGMDWFATGVSTELAILKSAIQIEAAASASPAASQVEPLALAFEHLYPVLRERIVSEIASLISDVLQQVQWPSGLSLGAQKPPAPAPAAAAATPGFSKLPSVLVVGLRGGQMEEVRRDCGKRLDVRFVGADESKDKLRAMCEQTDYAVAMTDFISHSHEDILAKRAKEYIKSSGGLTRLKELLHDLEPSRELTRASTSQRPSSITSISAPRG